MTAAIIPLRPAPARPEPPNDEALIARLSRSDCDGEDICRGLNSRNRIVRDMALLRVAMDAPSEVDEHRAESRWRAEHPQTPRQAFAGLTRRQWLGMAAGAAWPLLAWGAAWIISAGH